MAYPILKRADEALDPADTAKRLTTLLGQEVLVETIDEFGEFTVRVAPKDWVRTLEALRDDDLLAYDMFDCLFAVDRGEDGFDVFAVVYSTSKGRRILAVTRCDGGRDAPTCPSAVDVFRGVDFMERETWDMFGIEFDGHPGLAPRILCAENFEGWPLRRDFFLVSREVKPWPGIKDPAELDEDGNVIESIPGPGEAPGPSGLDEIMAEQAKRVHAPDEPDAVEAGDGGDAVAEAPAREEVEIDQETYDKLIAEGKSERVARSKAKRAAMKKAKEGGESSAPAEPAAPTPAAEAAVAEPEVATDEAPAAEEPVATPTASFPTNDDGEPYDQATYDENIAKGKPERVAMSKAKRAAAKMDAPVEAAPSEAATKADDARKAQAEARAEKAAEATPVEESADTPRVPEGAPIEPEASASEPEFQVATDADGNEYDQATYDEEIAKGKPERVALSKAKRALAKKRDA